MSKLPELPTYAFTVHQMALPSLDVEVGALRASYFQEQGSFLLFKDAGHVVVEAFRTETVVRVVRTDEPVA